MRVCAEYGYKANKMRLASNQKRNKQCSVINKYCSMVLLRLQYIYSDGQWEVIQANKTLYILQSEHQIHDSVIHYANTFVNNEMHIIGYTACKVICAVGRILHACSDIYGCTV